MTDAREHLVLALDVSDLEAASALARCLQPWFGTAKVGYELYAAAGPAAFVAVHDLGMRVFADLKLHDIPNTVAGGARVLGRHGVDFLNFHAAGGVAMLRAGVEAFKQGASEGGHGAPISLAVTVLTSEANTDAFDERLAAAQDACCDGVVCSAYEAERARAAGLTSMVPGVRLSGGDSHDQARVATPGEAIDLGATWLVIGRAVTRADDPEAAAEKVHALVEQALRPH